MIRKSPVLHPVRPHDRKVKGKTVRVRFHYAGNKQDWKEIKEKSSPNYLMPEGKVENEVVVFRKDPDGTIVALFPDIPGSPGFITSYEHIGQHGSANYNLVMSRTKPAKPHEYADLKEELESMGYDLDVKQKRTKFGAELRSYG